MSPTVTIQSQRTPPPANRSTRSWKNSSNQKRAPSHKKAIPILSIFQEISTRRHMKKNVLVCKEYIKAGDIFQVVLAQRLSTKINVAPFQIYRALRNVNPSPYMYYLNCGEHVVVGASPESLVRVEEGAVETHPLAGTRPRGSTMQEDERLESETFGGREGACRTCNAG